MVFLLLLLQLSFLNFVRLFAISILLNYESGFLQNKIEKYFSNVFLEPCQTSTTGHFHRQKALSKIVNMVILFVIIELCILLF